MEYATLALTPDEKIVALWIVSYLTDMGEHMPAWESDMPRKELAEWYAALPRVVGDQLSYGVHPTLVPVMTDSLCGSGRDHFADENPAVLPAIETLLAKLDPRY